MDGRVVEWMVELWRVDEWPGRWVDGWMVEWGMGRWIGGRMDGRMDQWTVEEQTDGEVAVGQVDG